MPKVSVIMPVYNNAPYVQEAINSILNQTYTDFEFIIIDDGSTDNTLKIINENTTKAPIDIEIFKNKNSGVSSARNIGLEKCKTRYVAFLDADDRYHPMFVETTLNILNTNIYDTVASRYYFTDSINTKFDELLKVKREFKSKWEFLQLYTHKRIERVSFCNFVYNSEIIKNNGIIFDEHIKYGEDTLFLCKYLKHCDNGGIFIDASLYAYYRNPNSATHIISYRVTDNIIACTCSVNYWKSDTTYDENWGKYFIARSVWAAAKTFGENDHVLFKRFINSYSNIHNDMIIMRKYGDERTIKFSAGIYLFSPAMFEICMRVVKLIRS